VLQFTARRQPTEQVEALLASAGFREPTPLQEEYIPAALQGKDLVVESIPGEGKTVAQLVPYLLTPKPRKRGVSVLILVDSVQLLGKYETEYNRLPGARAKGKCAAMLGREAQAKDELRLLSRHPGLIVGTTGRIIDHIRRNNLEFCPETTVIINIPDTPDHIEFDRDVEFIMAKIPEKVQPIIFAVSADQINTLSYLLKRPVILSSAERRARIPTLHVYEEAVPTSASILRLVYGASLYNILILTSGETDAHVLKDELLAGGISCCLTREKDPEASSGEIPVKSSIRCCIATFGEASRISLSYDSIIFFRIPQNLSLFKEIGWAVSAHSPAPYFTVLASPAESEILSNLQEKKQMKMKKEVPPTQKEVLKGKLKSIIQHIKEEEDPDELNQYRKIVRKNVPMHLRSYVTAFLLKQAGGVQLSETTESDKMQTIFVSIGKNRKVFPRDLSRLFNKTLGLEPRDIGNIKVLDNYSFIDIPRKSAQKAIDELDGTEFHGRSITVNFARKKKE